MDIIHETDENSANGSLFRHVSALKEGLEDEEETIGMYEADSLSSVGFRHVVEDGLAILAGQLIQEKRRDFVLHDLATVINEANNFSKPAGGNAWFSSIRNHEALELYTLLDRRLRDSNKTWQEALETSARVLQQLAGGDSKLDEIQKQATTWFLNELLACVITLQNFAHPETETPGHFSRI